MHPYNFINFPREGRGVGIGILYNSSLRITLPKHIITSSMELVMFTISRKNQQTIIICIIYRSPNLYFQNFLIDFTTYISPNITCNTIILGDFNIHVNKSNLSSSIDFQELLVNNQINQHIDFPTHTCGNTLDLIITKLDSTLVSNFRQSILFSGPL